MHLFILCINAFLRFFPFYFSLRRQFFKLQIFWCLNLGNTIHHENNEEEFFYEISMHKTNHFEGFVEAKLNKNLLGEWKKFARFIFLVKNEVRYETFFDAPKQNRINVSSSLDLVSRFRCRLHFMQMFYIMYFNFQPT